ncbi:DUF3800 domain-containing protein [Hydrogenimonas sp.]
MSRDANIQMPIVQEILFAKGEHELALRLEGAYCEFLPYEEYDGWKKGALYLFLRPESFVYFEKFENKQELISVFEGFFVEKQITHIEFKINTSSVTYISPSDITYIFVDEAGDMDFSNKGFRYYMFNFLVKKRPFHLHEYISNYRYSLLERNLNPDNGKRIDIESFHANEDNKYVKQRMFDIISTFDKNQIRVYTYILEKPKVIPDKRKEKDTFYINNLNYSIQQLLSILKVDSNFIIMTDRLPVKQNKRRQIAALKKGTKEYIKANKLDIRYDIFHHCSASSANLQVIDYIGWAIFRKYEHGDETYFKKIEKYITQIDEMTKGRKDEFYKKL